MYKIILKVVGFNHLKPLVDFTHRSLRVVCKVFIADRLEMLGETARAFTFQEVVVVMPVRKKANDSRAFHDPLDIITRFGESQPEFIQWILSNKFMSGQSME